MNLPGVRLGFNTVARAEPQPGRPAATHAETADMRGENGASVRADRSSYSAFCVASHDVDAGRRSPTVTAAVDLACCCLALRPKSCAELGFCSLGARAVHRPPWTCARPGRPRRSRPGPVHPAARCRRQALADLGETLQPLEARLADLDRKRLRAAMCAEAFEAEYAADRTRSPRAKPARKRSARSNASSATSSTPRLQADAARHAPAQASGPGGQSGNGSVSSAAGSPRAPGITGLRAGGRLGWPVRLVMPLHRVRGT